MKSDKPPQDFPYKTYLNILHGPLELIDVQKLADACADKWYNQTLCKVNDSVIRLAVIQGEPQRGPDPAFVCIEVRVHTSGKLKTCGGNLCNQLHNLLQPQRQSCGPDVL